MAGEPHFINASSLDADIRDLQLEIAVALQRFEARYPGFRVHALEVDRFFISDQVMGDDVRNVSSVSAKIVYKRK